MASVKELGKFHIQDLSNCSKLKAPRDNLINFFNHIKHLKKMTNHKNRSEYETKNLFRRRHRHHDRHNGVVPVIPHIHGPAPVDQGQVNNDHRNGIAPVIPIDQDQDERQVNDDPTIDREMDVIPYDEDRGLYIDIASKFMIKLDDNGTVSAVGKLHNDNIVRKLTLEEIQFARNMGLNVIEI
jgi:hypothetical protein